jgi:hypothetical protein
VGKNVSLPKELSLISSVAVRVLKIAIFGECETVEQGAKEFLHDPISA